MTSNGRCPVDHLLHPDTYAQGRPLATLDALRQSGPVVKLQDANWGVDFWGILDRDIADFVSKRADLFSAEERSTMVMEFDDGIVQILAMQVNNMDPPRHIKFRKILRSIFTVKAVDSYEERLRAHAQSIIANVVNKGKCEFVRDVAAELPLITILELAGIPLADRADFYAWTNTMIFADDPEMSVSEEEVALATGEILGYGQRLADQHRENPTSSIVGAMLDGTIDGESLSDEEFIWTFLLLIIAGNETTRNAISHAMHLFIQHPEQYDDLSRNPDLIPNAVEEILRYSPPVHGHRRTAKADLTLAGQDIKKGDKIVMFWSAVNRDEAYFENYDTFDIRRPIYADGSYQHRSFGYGEHMCLGVHLARMEIRLMLGEMIKHMANPRLDRPVKYVRSVLMHSIKEMPISFDSR